MDRERAETHLRLLAEAELRRVSRRPAGGMAARGYPARLALVAQALTAVGAVRADVASEIQTDVRLAVAARRGLQAQMPPGPGRVRTVPPRASWRIVPVDRVVSIQADDLRRDLPLVAFVQSAGGARFLVTEWPYLPFTVTAADDQGVSYQVSWRGEMAPRELQLKPDPPHQIRWLDLTAIPGEPATRIDLNPQVTVPDVTVTRSAHNPGELLLDVIAARILALWALSRPEASGRQAAATADPRTFIGDRPGLIVGALHAASALPPDSPVPGQLAGLCARLGFDGHGITEPAAGSLPDRWESMLARPSRGPQASPARSIRPVPVTELPGPDSARIAVAGLHHAGRGTILHVVATGITVEGDWPYATGLGPLTVLWIRDSDGCWHATVADDMASPWGQNGSNPWADTRMVTAWLRIIPPLRDGTDWIEISAAGRTAEVRARLRLRPR